MVNADGSVSEVASDGVLARLGRSLGGVVLGLALFVLSFVVLWWNEGNVLAEKQALGEMRRGAVEVDAARPSGAQDGRLVHATAKLESAERLGDTPFLAPGPYLALDRQVEMLQWVEKASTSTDKSVGGRETRRTTYTYAQEWAHGRQDSSHFKNPAGHANPEPAVADARVHVEHASFGGYDGLSVLEELGRGGELPVTEAMLAAQTKGRYEVAGGLVYQRAKKGKDALGDLRIRYSGIKAGVYSVLARQKSPKQLMRHVAQNGKAKLLVEPGRRSVQQMIGTAESAASTTAMVLRLVGFFMMWGGLCLLASPLGVVLDVIPMLGSLGRMALAGVFFFVAMLLSTVTVVVSMLAHRPLVLALALGGVAAFVFVIHYSSRARALRDAAEKMRAEQPPQAA